MSRSRLIGFWVIGLLASALSGIDISAQPISSASLTVSPAIELDEIDIDCITGEVTIEVLNIPLSCAFSVSNIYPSTVTNPPGNNTGVFQLSGATSATFHIDNGGCSMDSIVTFGCATSLGLGSLTFDVRLDSQQHAQISWDLIETEDILAYEVLESDDRMQFRTLERLETFPSLALRKFHIADTLLYPGTNYYRLVIHKKGGDSSLSDIRQVDFYDFDQALVYIYPNPNDGKFTALIYSSESDLIDIEVIDHLGRIVLQHRDHEIQKGSNEAKLSIAEYAGGSYILRYRFHKTDVHGSTQIFKE